MCFQAALVFSIPALNYSPFAFLACKWNLFHCFCWLDNKIDSNEHYQAKGYLSELVEIFPINISAGFNLRSPFIKYLQTMQFFKRIYCVSILAKRTSQRFGKKSNILGFFLIFFFSFQFSISSPFLLENVYKICNILTAYYWRLKKHTKQSLNWSWQKPMKTVLPCSFPSFFTFLCPKGNKLFQIKAAFSPQKSKILLKYN